MRQRYTLSFILDTNTILLGRVLSYELKEIDELLAEDLKFVTTNA